MRFDLAAGGETQYADGLMVSGAFFTTLGTSPFLGRMFSDADDRQGLGPDGAVAVISYGFWQRRFGGAPSAIGARLTLDRIPFTVIGIAPPWFFGLDVGRTFDVAIPFGAEPLLNGADSALPHRGDNWLTIVGRLPRNRSIAEATMALRAEQQPIWEATVPVRARPEYRTKYLSESFDLIPTADGESPFRDSYRRPLLIVMALVALVLLIACANIATLQLARGAGRRQELSVRLALGASRWDLVRPLLFESATIATVGTVAGAWLGAQGNGVLLRLLSTPASRVFLDLSVDWRVLTFTIASGAAATLVFGVMPSLRTSAVAPMDALRDPGRSTPGGGPVGAMNVLLVAQVAVSMVLVVAAGLFARTFQSLATRDAGFERDRALVVNVDTQRSPVAAAQRVALFARIEEAVRALPGVSGAATSMVTPANGFIQLAGHAAIPGARPLPENEYGSTSFTNVVSPGWFDAMGTPIVAGRDFAETDRAGTPMVAIINQRLAREALGGESALGRTITMTLPSRAVSMQIVGVVADAVYYSLRESQPPPTVYTPLTQFYLSPANLVSIDLTVRATHGAPSSLARAVGTIIREIDPALAFTFVPLERQLSASLTQERLLAEVSGFFGALALILAAIGLYGVTAYAAARRKGEIGIRMALGASSGQVVTLVLRRVAVLVALGIVIGVGLSALASRLVASLLFGLEPRDPATFTAGIATLAAVGIASGWPPAYRASRMDPANVLRDL